MRPASCIALLVLATFSGCGGDGQRAARAGAGQEAEVREAAVRAVTAFGPDATCGQVLTADLVRRMYGGVAACRRIETESDAEPPTGARVVAVSAAGTQASARVIVEGGDTDGTAGGLQLRYQDGGWRVSDLDADFLRSNLAVSVAHGDVAALRDPAARRCLVDRLGGRDDAAFKRFAYAAIARRSAALRTSAKAMARCRVGGRSLLRAVFEQGVRETIRAGGAQMPKAVIACVIRRLRRTVSEAELIARFAARDHDVSKMQRKGADAARACGPAGGNPPALS